MIILKYASQLHNIGYPSSSAYNLLGDRFANSMMLDFIEAWEVCAAGEGEPGVKHEDILLKAVKSAAHMPY